MADSPLRVAVMGLGFMGATHLRAWYKVAGAEVTAVVSSHPRKLAGDLSNTGGNLDSGSAQFDFGRLKRYADLTQALTDPEIDAVDLCLPTHLHFEAGMAALRAGKHVFLEKPLARTSQEAYALVQASKTNDRVLMAGHVLRFFPEWRNLAATLRGAAVKLASFRRNCAQPKWSPWLSAATLSGGAALDLLIHDADFVLHCFGIPDRIAAVGFVSPELGIDWLSANLSFPGGNAAAITGGWHPAPDYPFSMEFGAVTPERSLDWSSRTAPAANADPWATQLEYFAQCARENMEPALSPPAESARAVRLIEIMVESRKRNGDPLPWTD